MYLAEAWQQVTRYYDSFSVNGCLSRVMPFQDQPNGTRAKAHQAISKRPAAPQANGTRAKAHQVVSGHAPQQQPTGTRAKAAQIVQNPVLNGPHVREAIRIFVFVEPNDRKAIITYSKIMLARRGDAEIRTEISTTSVVGVLVDRDSNGPVEIAVTGHSGPQRVCDYSSIRREQAHLDLKLFNEYVRKVKAYRDSIEFKKDLDHKHLPILKVTEFNEDMTTATLAGTLPFGLSVKPASVAQNVAPQAAAFTRWTATRLSRLMGKEVGSGAVAELAIKAAQAVGLPKSIDKLQAQWGGNYADPRERPLCVYADLRMGGHSIYQRDVSPAWVKTAHEWLYKLVFGTLGKML
ncbi:hypothetical protein [Hymenobacter weizhouensis]|uniref:hypothetical protein n=1 Tax=Hymenobacter sp. YIM 151500-1 TaxID=2987689 RepID=UPI0022261A7C|nr:hypothetical protein [Hymenobacter sp. YIM 151500-1]UYZ62617.1 hypothetical protein OIS53_16645 [Hymenobacter sp. YIM 151500-1]